MVINRSPVRGQGISREPLLPTRGRTFTVIWCKTGVGRRSPIRSAASAGFMSAGNGNSWLNRNLVELVIIACLREKQIPWVFRGLCGRFLLLAHTMIIKYFFFAPGHPGA